MSCICYTVLLIRLTIEQRLDQERTGNAKPVAIFKFMSLSGKDTFRYLVLHWYTYTLSKGGRLGLKLYSTAMQPSLTLAPLRLLSLSYHGYSCTTRLLTTVKLVSCIFCRKKSIQRILNEIPWNLWHSKLNVNGTNVLWWYYPPKNSCRLWFFFSNLRGTKPKLFVHQSSSLQ